MPLEQANYINELSPVYPSPTDQKKVGDDHIRLTKRVLKNCFPGFTGAVLVGGQDIGVANACVLMPASPLPAYTPGMGVLWVPLYANTGAATINISGLGVQPIQRLDGSPLAANDIIAGQPVVMLYTGAGFRFTTVTKAYVDDLVFSGVLPGQADNGGKPLITDGTNASFRHNYGVAIDEAKGTTITAAPTIDLTSGPGTGNYLHIAGSSPISTIILPEGAERTITFDGNPPLVNSASLILPGGASFTAKTNDVATVRGEGGGVVRVTGYAPASGRAVVEQTPPGFVLLAAIAPEPNTLTIDLLNVFSATYDDYMVIASGLDASMHGGASIGIRLAKGGVVDMGTVYRSVSVGADAGSRTDAIIVAAFNYSQGVIETLHANVSFHGMNESSASASHYLRIGSAVFGDGAVTKAYDLAASHQNQPSSTGAISGFQLVLDPSVLIPDIKFSGAGTIKVYGIRKT